MDRQFRFIRLEEVKGLTGLSRSTIYAYIHEGNFPSPVSLGKRSVAWVDQEVYEWMSGRVQVSRAS